MKRISSKKRLFVGLPVPPAVSVKIGKELRRLERKHWRVRWVPEENWHVTVVFLGAVEESDLSIFEKNASSRHAQDDSIGLKRLPTLSSIQKLMTEVASRTDSFRLQLKGLGQFPRQKSRRETVERVRGRMLHQHWRRPPEKLILPRSIHLTLRGDLQSLHQLHEQLIGRLKEQGISIREKQFWPHLTLGRVQKQATRGERREMAKEIEKRYELDLGEPWEVDGVVLYESTLGRNGANYTPISLHSFTGSKA